MNHRPKLKLKATRMQVALNVCAWLIFGGSIVYLIVKWGSLPDKVPMHFNGAGEVDRWGGKGGLLVLPVIGAALWFGCAVLEKFPHLHNYMNLNERNAERQYRHSQWTLNVIKNEMIVVFALLIVEQVQVAAGRSESLGVWFLPVFLAVIFGTLAISVVKSFRFKNEK